MGGYGKPHGSLPGDLDGSNTASSGNISSTLAMFAPLYLMELNDHALLYKLKSHAHQTCGP